MIAALDTHARDRADTARLLTATIEGVGALAQGLPGVLASETDALVRAMQFADAVAQRIDHIRAILSRGGTAELVLAAAQTEALIAATRETASGVHSSLSRIEATATDSGRALSADGDTLANPAARAIDLGRSLLTALAEETGQRFASLAGATDAIHISAINAALLSRTETGHERAMTVLSVDVQQQAAACARASEDCKAAIGELALADDLGVFAAVSEKAGVFRRSVAETAEAIAAAEAALADMGRLRLAAAESLEALGPAILRARESMGGIAATADDLVRLVGDLPRSVPPGSGRLEALLDLYTMEAERVVHRRLFGLPEPLEPALSATSSPTGADNEADPLAAVLF